MKKLPLLLLVFSLFTFSCGSDDSGTSPVTPEVPEVPDNFKLLAVNRLGKVFEIDSNTGETHMTGQITSQTNSIRLSTICSVGSKIYALENVITLDTYKSYFIIYDKITGTTTAQQLVLPPSITASMSKPVITSMKYSGTEFIATVFQNALSSVYTSKVISINPQNYQITDLEASFTGTFLLSTALINNKLYAATQIDGLHEIDLINKTTRELQANGARINGTRLSVIDNTRLAILIFKNQATDMVGAYEYNISSGILSEKSPTNLFFLSTYNGGNYGGAFFHNKKHLDFVLDYNGKLGILKINYETNNLKFIDLDYTILGPEVVIADILE